STTYLKQRPKALQLHHTPGPRLAPLDRRLRFHAPPLFLFSSVPFRNSTLVGAPAQAEHTPLDHRPLLPVPLSRCHNTSKSLPCSSFVIHWSAVRAILCKSRLTRELALFHLMCLQSFQLPAI